jgi:uncharacterized protein YdaU (DUF1376 family)
LSGKSPAFQFYPKDFLSDEKQIRMSLAAVGIYVRLLSHCWIESSLPSDERALARLAGATLRELRLAWPSIAPCFVMNAHGRLENPRLVRERETKTRFHTKQNSTGGGENPTKVAESLGNSSIRGPSSSASASASAKQIQALAAPAQNFVDEEIAEKAGKFLRKYQAIYAEERNGAHFPLKPVLHFQTACELVQGWPDLARLELMLRTFCKLPASEKMAWPGTPAQFKHLAPSIDARLRQAGS